MAQLKGIAINNFRVFKAHTQFDFAPITILTGPNSSGKSSLFKALLMLADSAKKYQLTELDFTGESHYLGNFEDVLNSESGSDTLTFDLDFTGEKDILFGMLEEGFSLRLEYDRKGLKEFSFLVPTTNKGSQLLFFSHRKEEDNKTYYRFFHFTKVLIDGYNKYLMKNHSIGDENNNNSPSKDFVSEILQKQPLLQYLQGFDIESVNNFIDSLENKIIEIAQEARGKLQLEISVIWTLIDVPFSPGDIAFDEDGNETVITEKVCNNYKARIRRFKDSIGDEYNDYMDIVGNFIIEELLSPNFLSFSNKLDSDIRKLNEKIKKAITEISEISYLEAIRANTKRIYAYQSQGTGINDLLLSYQRKISRLKSDAGLQKFLKNYIVRFNIGDDLEITNIEGAANKINILRKGNKINLADLGYGFTQFIAIPLKIATTCQARRTHILKDKFVSSNIQYYLDPTDGYIYEEKYNKPPLLSSISTTSEELHVEYIKRLEKFNLPAVNGPLFLLEEPETNLHPKLQSMLADFFVEACRTFEMTLVAETHSEYLVRKLQYLVSKGEIRPQDVAIYYFYPPAEVPEGRNQVERINIQPDGRLDNEFGSGFFDESAKLMMSLLTGEALN